MPVKYMNYKGDFYYLHEGLSKKGSMRCWFSKKLDRDCPEEMPKGYEIYEEPNGMVFLRKKATHTIKEAEINAVKTYITKGLIEKVDIKKNTITVYLAETRRSIYMPYLRFILMDQADRIFKTQRFCFRGSINDWIDLDVSGGIHVLAEKYCYYLGKASFYNLL